MTDTRIRTSLTRHAAGMREPGPDQAWEAGRAAYREHGIVCLHPDEVEKRLGWTAAQLVRNLGKQAFGGTK